MVGKGRTSSRSNIKTLPKLVKVEMRDLLDPSVCLRKVSLSPRLGGASALILDCTSRSYQDVTKVIYHRSKLYRLCHYIKSFSKGSRVKLSFFLLSSPDALNFFHHQLSPLITQTTPFLVNISMSLCFKLLNFLIFLLGQFLKIVLGNSWIQFLLFWLKLNIRSNTKL